MILIIITINIKKRAIFEKIKHSRFALLVLQLVQDIGYLVLVTITPISVV